jgi:hypothetical protein
MPARPECRHRKRRRRHAPRWRDTAAGSSYAARDPATHGRARLRVVVADVRIANMRSA